MQFLVLHGCSLVPRLPDLFNTRIPRSFQRMRVLKRSGSLESWGGVGNEARLVDKLSVCGCTIELRSYTNFWEFPIYICGSLKKEITWYCMKFQKIGAKGATADSCFGLIGPCQCSATLGGPATSIEDLRHLKLEGNTSINNYPWL